MQIPDEIRISDLETLKVLSDPLRVQILEQVGKASARGALTTVKHLSQALDVPATKLYYHIKLLEKHDLIRVAETRVASGILEKHYQARARRIRMDLDISQKTAIDRTEGIALALASIEKMLAGAYENVEKSLERRMAESGDQEPVAMFSDQVVMQLSPEQADEFIARLRALVREYEGLDQPGGLAFGLSLLFNPNYHMQPAQYADGQENQDFEDTISRLEQSSAHLPPPL